MKKLIATLVIVLFCFATLQAQDTEKITRYHWSGLINNKYPVDVCLEKKGRILQGQIVYTNSKNKTPIRLLGSEYEDAASGFYLQEMLPDGAISGTITGKINKIGGFEGTWFGGERIIDKGNYNYERKDGKEYPVHLTPANAPASKTFSWELTKDNCAGTYSYSFGELMSRGTLKLYKKNGKLCCTINANTSAPSFNMADIEEQECVWTDGRYVFSNGFEDNLCQFELIPFSDFVIINQINGEWPCGFGLNATVVGAYLKMAK